jgi:hypothetical protein
MITWLMISRLFLIENDLNLKQGMELMIQSVAEKYPDQCIHSLCLRIGPV